jgi:chromosome segregation ATPase
MKRVLIILLVLISLGLCAISVEQWRREARLNAIITERTRQLEEEHKKRIEFEEKADRFEKEIQRLTVLRAETEAALLEATEELRDRIADQSARGQSIAVLMNEVITSQSELAAYKDLAGAGTDAIKERNAAVAAQNAAIEKQNAQLKQLAAERDNAINQLNARTREFNELVERYNKLAKQQ